MTILLVLILAPLIILTLCFAVELLVGLRPLNQSLAPLHCLGSVVIIVPAHNEETMIGPTIEALQAAAEGLARILVVADNCTDATAAEGRTAGIEVIERNEADRRGKGFALDFARRHLQTAPPDLVVIIDADCRVDVQSLKGLIATCTASRRPCQASYLLAPASKASPPVQISNFAFFVRNVIRQRALQRLAGRVHLLGTGMAFPWGAFDREDLATSDIVEDLRMGIELAEAGMPPLFVESAKVWSAADTKRNTLTQRHRWEGGFLAHAIGSGPSLLRKSVTRRDLQALWAAIDLMVPPLALLIMLDLAAMLLGAALVWRTHADAWPLMLLAGALLAATAGLAGAWLRGGSQFVSARALAYIPFYLVWKLPIYLGFAKGGAPKEWLRTRGIKA